MKVNIGPYLKWWGPYQIAELLLFWIKRDPEETNDIVHRFGTWLAEDRHGNDSYLLKLCQWIESKRKRKIKIRIDNYDVWSMDSTLAPIIYAMLIKLGERKQGYPRVDDEDVPDELKSGTSDPFDDPKYVEKWNWIFGEMVWAFGELCKEDGWEEQYYSGTHDVLWQALDDQHNPIGEPVKLGDRIEGVKWWQMTKGPNDTFKMDHDGIKTHGDRIRRGTTLFGKYFQCLWD